MVETVNIQKGKEKFASTSFDWKKGLSEQLKFKQISSKGNHIWAISTDNRLWHRELDGSWKCIEQEKMCDVSVGTDGSVIALSESEGYPYILDKKKLNFLQLENPIRLKQVSVGDHKTIWGLKDDGSTWKFFEDSETWKQMALGNIHFIKYLSCANDKSCWAIDRNGVCLRWEKDQWKEVSKDYKFKDISAAGHGVVYGVLEDSGQVLFWNSSKECFEKYDKQVPSHLKNITAVDENHWFGIDENGKIEYL